MRIRLYALLLFVLCSTLALTACANRRSTADVPRLLGTGYKISVAPFTQPTNTGLLIAGRIPEAQGRIPADMLNNLDRQLREVLMTATKRQYTFIPDTAAAADPTVFHSSEQPQGLSRWVAFGKKHNAQLLLVPQVLDWHERQGSKGGVTQSAHVRVEFYLLNVAEGTLMNRSSFEEQQVGLTENLLTMGSFFKRRGTWVTAEELSTDGMRKAVGELGL